MIHLNDYTHKLYVTKKRSWIWEGVDLGEVWGGNGGNNVNTILMYEILKEQLNKNRGIQVIN